MKEDFLHYIWKYKLFSTNKLTTTLGEEITVLKSGDVNTNSGADFLNAQLKINNQTWVGNVEIHVKSSDWYLHNHETDVNYDAVILHVVWQYDAPVFMKNNQPLPTLVLKDVVEKLVFLNYKKLFAKEPRWILCQNEIKTIDVSVLNSFKEQLFFERLEQKEVLINQLLKAEKNNFEAVLFQLLIKNFGLKVNGEAFLKLAKSIPFSLIRKLSFDAHKLEALFFGQAGFLEVELENEHHSALRKEYSYLKHTYKLQPILNNEFSFFRMRPNNFPTIRIAQLVALFNLHQNLFSKLMEIKTVNNFYTLLSLDVPQFWKTHFTFEKVAKKSARKITISFIDLLLINTVIPLKYVYEKSRGEVDKNEILRLMQGIKPEKNSIISKFKEIEVLAKSAFDSQALLELKNNYCAPKRCLACTIGSCLLR